MSLSASEPDPDRAASPERFRDVFRHWAAHVALVAVRDDDGGRVYGTTATSLTPVAADPPTVLVSLGPTAQALPFLSPGRTYVVNLLAQGQARLAETYADSFPVGPPPFPPSGLPIVEGSLAFMVCRVIDVIETVAGSRLVLGRVIEATVEPDRAPLIYRRRRYTTVAPDER